MGKERKEGANEILGMIQRSKLPFRFLKHKEMNFVSYSHGEKKVCNWILLELEKIFLHASNFNSTTLLLFFATSCVLCLLVMQ